MKLKLKLKVLATILLLMLLPVPSAHAADKCVPAAGSEEGLAMAISGNNLAIAYPSRVRVWSMTECRTVATITTNSFTKTLQFSGGRLYLGGNFTTVSGVSRKYAAAVSTSTWKLVSWNPGATSKVNSISVVDNFVFVATSPKVWRFNNSTGRADWSASVAGGPIRTVYAVPAFNRLYVGGQFDVVDGWWNRHNMAAFLLNTPGGTPSPDWYFNPDLRKNTGDDTIVGPFGPTGDFDGDNPLTMAADGSTGLLIMGSGSSHGNYLWPLDPYNGQLRGTRRQHEGDVQTVQVVPYSSSVYSGYAYFGGNHRVHGRSWDNPCDTGVYGTIWPSAGRQVYDGCDIDWQDGMVWTVDRPNNIVGWENKYEGGGGFQASAFNWSTRVLYVCGAFRAVCKSYQL